MSTINKLKRGAGGARPGAGRPVTTHTQQQVDHVNKILRKYARKTGRDLYEIAADMAWALEEFEKTGDPTRRFGIQFLDGASRVAGGDDTEREFPGPAVYLPEKKPDMAKVVNLRESQEDPPRDPVWKEGAGWIGVDLDGTLAHQSDEMDGSIGPPVPAMLERVKRWLGEGKTVKIFTARWHRGADEVSKIQDWCQQHGLPRLDVTASKNLNTIEVWDDHAVSVERNTGTPLNERDENGEDSDDDAGK